MLFHCWTSSPCAISRCQACSWPHGLTHRSVNPPRCSWPSLPPSLSPCRNAETSKTPVICVVGGKEAEANALSVRLYGGQELGSIPVQVGQGRGGRGGRTTQGRRGEQDGVQQSEGAAGEWRNRLLGARVEQKGLGKATRLQCSGDVGNVFKRGVPAPSSTTT